MEEVLVLVLQFIIEIAIELFAWMPFDWPTINTDDRRGWWVGGVFLFVILGGFFGFLMNLWHQHLFLPYPWLRIANLMISPLASGAFAWWVATLRRRRRHAKPGRHFFYAYSFSLAFLIVRFAYGAR